MATKMAELRWWLLVIAVLMSGLAVDRFIQGHGRNGIGEAILAAALWACTLWGFSHRAKNPPASATHWNPIIISSHGEGSFNRTLVISGVAVVIGIVLLVFNFAIGLPIVIGALVVPISTWRNTRHPR